MSANIHMHAMAQPMARRPGLHALPSAQLTRSVTRERERFTHTAAPWWHSTRAYSYPCPELRQAAGITADRMAAFNLPSRRGDRLHYPDGRVTDMRGNALEM